jgi:hypothetical protein
LVSEGAVLKQTRHTTNQSAGPTASPTPVRQSTQATLKAFALTRQNFYFDHYPEMPQINAFTTEGP